MQTTLRSQTPPQRAITLFCWALMILSPFLTLAALSLITGHNVFTAYPVWSNELGTWRTLANWNAVGLASGYNGFFEATPAMGSLGLYGFSPILIYGWFVKLFGLAPSAIVLCNAVWVSLASLVFCLLHRPKPFVSLAFTALFCTYTPILLYCFTSMTELFDYAVVIFYLAFLLKYRQNKSGWMLAFSLLTVLLASFYRITFFLLFFPIAWVYGGSRMSVKTVLAALTLLAASAGCYLLSAAFTSPNQQGFLYNLLNAESFAIAFQLLMSHTKSNLIDYINIYHVDAVQWDFRRLYLIAMLLCLIGSLIKRESKPLRLKISLQKDAFMCFLWLFGQLLIIMALYETNDWADFRILAPVLWLVPVCLLFNGHRVMPTAILAGMLALLLPLCQNAPIGAFGDAERFAPPAIETRYTNAAAHIIYDPAAQDPFANTVRTDLSGWPLNAALEPGLGLEYGWFTPETIGRSRWLLTDTLKMPIAGYEPVYREHGIALYRLSEQN